MEPFYEGREKVLRVRFRIVEDMTLLDIDKHVWDDILEQAGCKIISVLHAGSKTRVYLLSESSLFVWTKHLILKTCGSTTPLKIVPLLFKQLPWIAGIEKLAYSHGAFLKPELQALGYRCGAEVSVLLSEVLPPEVGAGDLHVFSDNSFQYATFGNIPTLGNNPTLTINSIPSPYGVNKIPVPPAIVDIRMSKLRNSGLFFWTQDPRFIDRVFDRFFGLAESHNNSRLAESHNNSRPGSRWAVDGHHYQPHGYSLNALRMRGLYYATVHVTPEKDFSYASYETNDVEDVAGRLFRLVEIFAPEELTIVCTTASDQVCCHGDVTCCHGDSTCCHGEGRNNQIDKAVHETLGDYQIQIEWHASGSESTVQYRCRLRDVT